MTITKQLAEALREIRDFKWSSEQVNPLKHIAREALAAYDANPSGDKEQIQAALNSINNFEEEDAPAELGYLMLDHVKTIRSVLEAALKAGG